MHLQLKMAHHSSLCAETALGDRHPSPACFQFFQSPPSPILSHFLAGMPTAATSVTCGVSIFVNIFKDGLRFAVSFVNNFSTAWMDCASQSPLPYLAGWHWAWATLCWFGLQLRGAVCHAETFFTILCEGGLGGRWWPRVDF